MYTPKKSTHHRVMSSSYTPFSTLASSDASVNQGRVDLQMDSNSSLYRKKFTRTRKRDGSSQSGKLSRKGQASKKLLPKQQNLKTQPSQQLKPYQTARNLIEQPVLNTKYLKMHTQRSNQSFQYCSGPYAMRKSFEQTSQRPRQQRNSLPNMDYELQLEIKNNEFMVLQDQNRRLTKMIQSKTKQLENQKRQLSQQYAKKLKKCEQKIQVLENTIGNKIQLIERLQKRQNKLKSQLKKSQSQCQLLRIHLDTVIKKVLPKDLQKIQTFRQISLTNELKEIKKQLQLKKEDQEDVICKQLAYIKQQNFSLVESSKNLQITNRMLSKKLAQVDQNLEEQLNKQMYVLKEKLKDSIKQQSAMRKENAKLKQRMLDLQSRRINKNQSRKSLLFSDNNSINNSDDSFSFSLSK